MHKTSCKTKEKEKRYLTNLSNKKSKLVTKEAPGCSYEHYLVKNLALVVYGIKNCSKVLHHVYQNIDQIVYDGGFENKFGLAFSCPRCMTEHMIL